MTMCNSTHASVRTHAHAGLQAHAHAYYPIGASQSQSCQFRRNHSARASGKPRDVWCVAALVTRSSAGAKLPPAGKRRAPGTPRIERARARALEIGAGGRAAGGFGGRGVEIGFDFHLTAGVIHQKGGVKKAGQIPGPFRFQSRGGWQLPGVLWLSFNGLIVLSISCCHPVSVPQDQRTSEPAAPWPCQGVCN